MHRRSWSLAVGMVVVLGSMAAPASVAAANQPPVAVDDPAIPGCFSSTFGGAFPIPEDYWNASAGPGWEDWFAFMGACLPTANDFDPDGDPLTLELVGQPAHGQAIWGDLAPQVLAYKPDPNWSTAPGDQPGGTWFSDEIHYRVSDGTSWSNTASFRIWMAPINDPPTFTPGDSLVRSRTGASAVSVAWATDVSPGPNEDTQHVSFQVDTDTRNAPGMFAVLPAIDSDGVLTFTPGPDPGLATITVTAHDDGGLEDYPGASQWTAPPKDTSDPVTFEIVVLPPDAPTANDDQLTIAEDATAQFVDVLANDTDWDGSAWAQDMTVTGVAGGQLGSAELHQGGVTYQPNPDANGQDSFTYTIQDADGNNATGTVHVTITPVNDDPVAADDTLTTSQDAGATVVDVLANDSDIDGDTVAVQSVTAAGHGTSALTAGVVMYTPDAGYSGSDTFEYTVADGHGGAATATVTVNVQADATPPTVSAGTIEIAGSGIGTSSVQLRYRWHAADAGSGIASQVVQRRLGTASYGVIARPPAGTLSLVGSTVPGRSETWRIQASDRRGNQSGWGTWPAITTKLLQESSPSITWSGTWHRALNAADSLGATRYTTAKGARAQLQVRARAIAWVGPRRPGGGQAQVWVDGVLRATVNTNAAAVQRRAVLFRMAWSSLGSHRIEVRTLGGGRVDVDAFVIVG